MSRALWLTATVAGRRTLLPTLRRARSTQAWLSQRESGSVGDAKIEGSSRRDPFLLLTGPAAGLLACCTWNNNNNDNSNNSWDCNNGVGYRHLFSGGAPVLADGSASAAAGVEPPATDLTARIKNNVEDGGATVVVAKARARAEAAVRAARLVWTAIVISADYKAFDVSKAFQRATSFGEENTAMGEYEVLADEMWHAQEQQRRCGIEAETLPDPQERALARARSKEWHSKVTVAAKKIADAEAAGLRAPMSDLHRRSAERLRDLCSVNGGVYVKLGQHLSQLDFVLPPEFIDVLRCMLDQAPQTPIQDVREVIREELGEYPETLWRTFDPKAIASASLAQVHRAEGWNGEQLAVKVQHRGLRETSKGDVDAVSLVVAAVDRLFPKFSYKWLADEVERNLPRELDFLHEASNSRRCAAMFEGRNDICVPPVVSEQTAERVLTMKFEPGLRATDVEGMRAMGVSLPRVASLISEAFCEQMFRHGSVHCDPHGANVLVRPHPDARRGSGRPQLVLLDHGLYRELTDKFRVDHCRLWKAMVFKDIPGVKEYCQRLNSGDMYHLLAAILCGRSWDAIEDTTSGMDGLHTKDIETEKGMVRGYVQQYAPEIAMLLSKVDRQMLLLFKTNDCLRRGLGRDDTHIDRTLGAPINTFVIAAKTCISVLREEDAKEALARLGASERNFFVRGLLRLLYFVRGVPEALKVREEQSSKGIPF
ncbi:unnamed protein product [Ectocarpus sp. 4 AP-2014]